MFNDKYQIATEMFGVPHLIVLGIFILLITLLAIFRNFFIRSKVADNIFKYGIASFALVIELTYYVWDIFILKNNPVNIIPLGLCALTLFLTVLAIFTKKYQLFKVIFFWAITGAFLSIVVVDMNYSFPHFRFFHYFLSHFAFLILNLYMVITKQVKITFKDSLISSLTLFVLAIPLFFLNILLGTNFMFLSELPHEVASLFPDFGLRYGFLPQFVLVIFLSFQMSYWSLFSINLVATKLNSLKLSRNKGKEA